MDEVEKTKLVEENSSLKQDKENLVSEIQELREKKQLSEKEAADLKIKIKGLEDLNLGGG